jgi:diguanylate cyclase (GGDEF)-like protein
MRGNRPTANSGTVCGRSPGALKVLVVGDMTPAFAEQLSRAAGARLRAVHSDAREAWVAGEVDVVLVCPGSEGAIDRVECGGENVPVVHAESVDGPGDAAGLATALAEAAARGRSARRDRTRLRWLERDLRFDRLTGLSSRRALDEHIAELRRQGPANVAALAIDVCDMGQLNDLYGREAGDHALAALGRAVLRSVRSTDFAARWGGDKFVVLLESASPATCRKVARRVARELGEAARNDLSIPPVVLAFGMAASTTADPAEAVAEALAQAAERGARAPVASWAPLTDGPCVA